MATRDRERHRALPLLPEVRFFAPTGLEVREQADTNEIIITGQPIVYGVPYRVVDHQGEFKETMHAGCMTSLLANSVDCRFLFNHGGLPMARTSSGTMRLWDAPTALHFEARLDARQQLANDFAIAIQRGDISQMSVGMIVAKDRWSSKGNTEVRDIFQLRDLLDVSGVTYPCSPTTSIEVARRMALAIPIESRARLRRTLMQAGEGKPLDRETVRTLRQLVGGDTTRATEVRNQVRTRLGKPPVAGDATKAILKKIHKRQRKMPRAG